MYRFSRRGRLQSSLLQTRPAIVRLAAEKGQAGRRAPARVPRSGPAGPSPAAAGGDAIYDDLEIFNLTDSIIQLQKEFGGLTEVKWLFGSRLPKNLARDLVAGTTLKDPAVRKRYLDGGYEMAALSEVR